MVLVSPQAANRPGFLEALRPLIGRIDVAAMRQANYRVDAEHWLPRKAADKLLERVGTGG